MGVSPNIGALPMVAAKLEKLIYLSFDSCVECYVKKLNPLTLKLRR